MWTESGNLKQLLLYPYFYIEYLAYLDSQWMLISVSAITYHPGMFLSLDFVWEYWIELIAMELPCIRFTCLNKIFCRVAQGFMTGCIYGVWLRGPLWVGPLFSKPILNELVCKFHIMQSNFHLSYIMMVFIDLYYCLSMLACCISFPFSNSI